jgi:hypothetical protein
MNARKTRRRFTNEFKSDAVGLVVEQGYSCAEVGRRLGVSENNVNRWVRQYRDKHESTSSDGLTREQLEACLFHSEAPFVYVFQLPNDRLINHITNGSSRMALYTKELHFLTLKKRAMGRRQNFQRRPKLQSSEGSASFTLRARSPALHLSLRNVPVCYGNPKRITFTGTL